ncbi:MAG TPA: PqqD family protein [Smithellaceae bacterium]|mgnify:CR=1 FL=1|nr:PqqD family protein [Smithellaceae bacterium]
MEMRYTTDLNNVLFESIEAELVVINLKSGCYYSLNESASIIWKLVMDGYSIRQISDLLKKQYPSSTADISGDIARLVSQCVGEELLSEAGPGDPSGKSDLPDGLACPERFEPPSITKHSDIQDMLALDPIHEVTDLGWPHKKEQSE